MPGHYLNQLYLRLTRGTNGSSSNLKNTICNIEHFDTYKSDVCEMSALWLGLSVQCLISWYDLKTCKYYALCCCVFKIAVLYVKRRFVLYCSRARVRLCSPFRNYSVEAFYNDVPECIGMKAFRKACEIHSFSMTFSSNAFLFWKAIFIKGAS